MNHSASRRQRYEISTIECSHQGSFAIIRADRAENDHRSTRSQCRMHPYEKCQDQVEGPYHKNVREQETVVPRRQLFSQNVALEYPDPLVEAFVADPGGG